MTKYFLGIEDLTDNPRFDGYIHKATFEYQGPIETEDRIKIIEPEGITWLDGEPFKMGVRNKPPEKYPVVSNRPTEDNSGKLIPETLTYDREQSSPHSDERLAVYHPIVKDGLLEVLLHGERRQIRVTLVAEYVEHSGILHDDVAEVVKLNTANIDDIPAIAA